MTAEITPVLNRLVSVYRDGQTLALFFDYDGTLTPIVQHPSWARLASGTRQTLARLAAFPRVRVGIFSGRSLVDLKNLVGIPDLIYSGTSGLEIEYRGIPRSHADIKNATGLLADIAQRLAEVLGPYTGAWLEKKPFGLTVHFRHVVPQQIERLRSDVAQSLDPFAVQLRAWPGPMAIEMVPELGWDKGTALRATLSMISDNCTMLYAGDHANDAEAFAVVNALRGITLGVGPDAPPAAQHSLEDPDQLQRFTGRLADELHRISINHHR